MKKILFFLTLLTMTTVAVSQNLIIHDSTYKAGIYRTFEEFKYNNPSINFHYEVTTKDRRFNIFKESHYITHYRIVIDKKAGKSIGNVFGFCDGKNVYINDELPRLGPKTGFLKIEYFGRYCYYEDILCTSYYNGTSTSTMCNLDDKIIDIESGEVIRLSKKTLREIIADDPELLNEFNDESKKNKKLKDYIIRYLERQ